MNILLTGGSGFIGRNILESFLAEKYNILAPSHRDLDLTDEKATELFFAANSIDVVIHAAGKPGHRNAKDPSNIFYADMRMFLNLLRNEDHFGKMIVISSGAIYDQRFEIKKTKEGDYIKHLPADEHALYRYACAKLAEGNKKITELRIFGIFGKYEDYAIRFISNAICKTLFNLPVTIKQNRKFDYLFVDDLMPILDYFVDHEPKQSIYNITPNESIELFNIAKKVLAMSGKDLPIKIAQEGMGLEYSGDNARLKREIGNLKFTPIDEAIKKLYQWYSGNKSRIGKKLLMEDK